MRNSFELLDWLKVHLGGGGGAADVPLADSVTPGIVKLTHEVSHEESEHTAVAPDGVAAYVDGNLVPLTQKCSQHVGITGAQTTGTATCDECATGLILNLNLRVTGNINDVAVAFPLDHAERFSDAVVFWHIAGARYKLRRNGLNLNVELTGALDGQSCVFTITVPYF